jgi:chromosome segregation ATPase
MATLLKQLGDDWHKSHPYEPLIRKVLPSTPYLSEIEDSLCSVYVAAHNDFKIYKTPTNHTVYDMDIDIWTDRKKKIQEEMKHEEDTLEKLAKKFADVQKFIDPTLVEEEGEEDEEEDVILPVERGSGKQRLVPQLNKTSVKTKKQEEIRMAKQANLTKANMASCQEKLMSLQKETEEIEKKIDYYGHYRDASLGFSRSMKRLIQSYEQIQDLEALIKELADLHSYYDMMRRRYVPKGTCSGSREGLCETHLLPLRPAIYSSTGMTVSSRCSLYPV